MHVSDEEQRMLDGDYGRTVQKCAQILVKLGEIFDAERMVKINNVHTPGVSYRVAGDAGLTYVKDSSTDASFCVPTTLNTVGIDVEKWKEIGFPEDFSLRQLDLIEAYKKMGAVELNTCTPFLCGNLPSFGEHIAWGESSAVCFANSVLGARTNREGGPSALAAAVIGRVPAYGFHLDENRKGSYIIDVRVDLKTNKDFAVLGYFTGKRVGKEVPVFTGINRIPTLENYKALCAACASSGAVALFHIVGITPEAPALEAVIADHMESIIFNQTEYDKVCEKFSYSGPVDFVVIGCPHVSIEEMKQLAQLLDGKKIKSGMWICSSRSIADLADRMGYGEVVRSSGAEIICDTCPVLCHTLSERGYKTLATNSGKMAHYAPGHWNLQPLLLDVEDCVKAAVSGEWRKSNA